MPNKNHKEEIWVKKLCKKIRDNDKFKSWAKDEIIIEDNVALAHSIDLNNLLIASEDEKERLFINYDNIENIDLERNTEKWNVDILVGSKKDNHIVPRLIIEAKYRNINTHDPITYSYKAFLHKNLFKGLRYGLIVGNYNFDRKEENVYIPTRLVEHGDNFDFMFLLKDDYNDDEIGYLIDIIIRNVSISEKLESLNIDKENRYQCIMKDIEFNPKFDVSNKEKN